jgi:hypothetical protein
MTAIQLYINYTKEEFLNDEEHNNYSFRFFMQQGQG